MLHALRLAVPAAALTLASLAATPAHATCPADLDNDRTVAFSDLVILLSAWGPCPGDPCVGDLDGNLEVDFGDLVSLLAQFGDVCGGIDDVVPLELVGEPRPGTRPDFDYIVAQAENETRSVAIDPAAGIPAIGPDVDVYVVDDRDLAGWTADQSLVDVRGAAQVVTFPAGVTVGDSAVELTGTIPGEAGLEFGRAYDVVIDVDGSGSLNAGDIIDGLDDAGFWVVGDTTVDGPLPVGATIYGGGTFMNQITRFPDVDGGGPYPLVVISHGNGHSYTWYAYLQFHLASRGYVVMSHTNNTQPGIETASTTTLTNTDFLLANRDTVGGGQLAGKIDPNQIIWIGHSRGGEGVVRAYDRIRDGTFTPAEYDLDDIKLVSSIAPTDFLGPASASPLDVNYHFIFGSADGDVSGSVSCQVCQAFSLYERATSERSSIYVHGADHNDFNCCGFNDFCGGGAPCSGALAIGREEAQRVLESSFLAAIRWYVHGDPAAREFLSRQYEDLRPVGVADTVTVDREYRPAPADRLVIEDYQTEFTTDVASSGGAVTATVSNLDERRMDDANNSLSWTPSDPMNGMARARSTDATRCAVFDWSSPANLEIAIVPAIADWSGFTWLQWRSCQGTRHPQTTAVNGDLSYAVTLIDGSGTEVTVDVSSKTGGAEEPFARTGLGSGTGWQNEFETKRIRLADFTLEGTGLDLTNITAIRFDFGEAPNALQGRLGFDDVEVSN